MRQCWEANNCTTETRDQCPAYPDRGRVCFGVTGTFCQGEVQGGYKDKIEFCRDNCLFFAELMKDSGAPPPMQR